MTAEPPSPSPAPAELEIIRLIRRIVERTQAERVETGIGDDTAVLLPQPGANPLPRNNHRYGQPTPQKGVEVERKWHRPDYRPPGTLTRPENIPERSA